MQRWEYLTIGIYFRRWADSLGRTGILSNMEAPMYGDATEILNGLGEQG